MIDNSSINPESNPILRTSDTNLSAIEQLCSRYGLVPKIIAPHEAIPGSFWGDEEAGLVNNILYLRDDTPLHSLLHEACHYICMSAERRANLDTNAGGDYAEENAVCYLQILLANTLPPLNPARIMADMDSWGYSFRLGSAARWFAEDAEDARQWLLAKHIIDQHNTPTGKLR